MKCQKNSRTVFFSRFKENIVPGSVTYNPKSNLK